MDMLSRLLVDKPDFESPDEFASVCMLTINELLVSSQQIAEATHKDTTYNASSTLHTFYLEYH